jgi:hypothetical protein
LRICHQQAKQNQPSEQYPATHGLTPFCWGEFKFEPARRPPRPLARLAETKALKAWQDSARANRQRATQELDKKLEDGREKAMRFRAAVKANLGPKNEQLVQFGMVPLRKRGPREKPPEVKPPEEVPKPEPPPAISSSK